jgi:hypothetical protein
MTGFVKILLTLLNSSNMKKYNQTEVILFSKYSLRDSNQKEFIRWLGTTAQSAIGLQQAKAKKLFLRRLKDSPPVYMS